MIYSCCKVCVHLSCPFTAKCLLLCHFKWQLKFLEWTSLPVWNQLHFIIVLCDLHQWQICQWRDKNLNNKWDSLCGCSGYVLANTMLLCWKSYRCFYILIRTRFCVCISNVSYKKTWRKLETGYIEEVVSVCTGFEIHHWLFALLKLCCLWQKAVNND